jgi:hypothetical protein
MKPEEEQQASIDLSTLSTDELALMLKLVESGRLKAVPDQSPDAPSQIEGEAEQPAEEG